MAASWRGVGARWPPRSTRSRRRVERTGLRSDGAHFTVDSFARYFLHDIEHHLWDVTARPAGSWL